jgi:excisionase family DNA binding protein
MASTTVDKRKILTQDQADNISAQVAELSGTKILTQEQVAEILLVTTDTLEAWRYKKRYGLPYLKIGSLVRYRESDVLAFLESRLVSGEPQPSGAGRRARSRRAA